MFVVDVVVVFIYLFCVLVCVDVYLNYGFTHGFLLLITATVIAGGLYLLFASKISAYRYDCLRRGIQVLLREEINNVN